MGGNALKDIQVRRVLADEYHKHLVPEAKGRLKKLFGARVEVVPAYREKESFGDIDILLEADNLPANWHQQLFDDFQPASRFVNNVVSIEFHGTQLDIVPTPKEEFDWTLGYYAFNDLGNLIGRISSLYDIRFGHRGMHHWVYDLDRSTYVFRQLRITLDWDAGLNALGFDVKRWHAGFDKLEDIFDFVVDSKYFQLKPFLLENRNHRSRVRDRKRKSYMSFLEYVKSDEVRAKEKPLTLDTKGFFKEVLKPAFPEFYVEYQKAFSDMIAHCKFHRLYNGRRVTHVTGLTGKPMGDFMRWAKPIVQDAAFDLINEGQEVTDALIMKWHAAYLEERGAAVIENNL